jgi:hypothetical protein
VLLLLSAAKVESPLSVATLVRLPRLGVAPL